MYAVIQTGGKQYRVRAGDVIIVDKLEGDVGSAVSFDRVLMIGGEGGVTIGAPAIEGALVSATLIETRKGEKIKVFKKIRRQGYRRTQGHRQFESVLRITGLEGLGQSMKWDGTVDLTPRSVINARARGLAPKVTTPEVQAQEVATPVAAEPAPAPKKAKAPKAAVEQPISETPAAGAQTDVDAAASTETGSMASEETKAAAPKKPKAPKAPKASPAGEAE